MTSILQRVELTCYRVPLHCPFCGQGVINTVDDDVAPDVETITPCAHTLYESQRN